MDARGDVDHAVDSAAADRGSSDPGADERDVGAQFEVARPADLLALGKTCCLSLVRPKCDSWLERPFEAQLRAVGETLHVGSGPVEAEPQCTRPFALRYLEHDVAALAAGFAEQVKVVGEHGL